MSATTYKVLGLGARYAGRCVVCGRDTGSRDWERAETVLLRDSRDGKYAVAHPTCIGVRVRHGVGGGRSADLPATVEA